MAPCIQLPRYALGLRQLESRLGKDFQRSDAEWFERELEAWWDTILLQAMPGVVELLQQLSDEQVAKLVTNLRDEAMEYQKEYGELSEAKWRDKWFERAREGVERLSGRLDDPQLAVLRDFQQRVEQDDGPWVTYRLRWIDGLEEVLQTRNTKPEEFAARFLAMSRDREAWYTESYRLVEAANDEHYRNLAVALTRALNEKQLGRVRKRLADLVADFEELSTG